MVCSVKGVMSVSLGGIPRREASDWEFQCATDDWTPDKVRPCTSPMDEVLEGVYWFMCPDSKCCICVLCGFIRCPLCGVPEWCDDVEAPAPGMWAGMVSCESVGNTEWKFSNFVQTKGHARGLEEVREDVELLTGIGRHTGGVVASRGKWYRPQ